MMRRLLAILALSAFVAACGSSPTTEFISLQPVAADARTAVDGPPLAVAQVNLPSELNRRALVVRTGDATLDVRGTERWAAPLEIMARRTLAQNLAARIDGAEVILPGQAKPSEPMQLISVVLQTFSAGPDNEVLLAGRWSLLRGTPRKVVLQQQEEISVSVASASAADIAAAMSEALAKLADRIAKTLAQEPAGKVSSGRPPSAAAD